MAGRQLATGKRQAVWRYGTAVSRWSRGGRRPPVGGGGDGVTGREVTTCVVSASRWPVPAGPPEGREYRSVRAGGRGVDCRDFVIISFHSYFTSMDIERRGSRLHVSSMIVVRCACKKYYLNIIIILRHGFMATEYNKLTIAYLWTIRLWVPFL